MAIARDSTVNTATQSSWSHTCAAGAVLYVMFYISTNTVTSVTYDGTAMTELVKFNYTGTRYMNIYGLLNPATGTNTVAINTTGGTIYAGSASYTGVVQSGFTGITDTSSTPSGTAVQIDLTTLVDNAALIGFCLDGPGNGVANAGSAFNTASTGLGIYMIDSSPLPTTPAGAHSIGYTNSASYLYMCGTVINPAVSGPTSIKSFSGLATASVKSVDGLAMGSIKSFNGLT